MKALEMGGSCLVLTNTQSGLRPLSYHLSFYTVFPSGKQHYICPTGTLCCHACKGIQTQQTSTPGS